MALDASILHFIEVSTRKLVRTHFVKEEIDFDTRLGSLDQSFLKPLSDSVVLHNEEIDEQILLCVFDMLEELVEGFFAIDE